ncbi:hypothetical protein [Ileibacterium valens]|uniref:hypothetical protein n=1 Tax=Ileibacterium valens TaxID=1862668 RepID=UPI0015B7909E|nr:hypothetical protein [Ileibacterium valens]
MMKDITKLINGFVMSFSLFECLLENNCEFESMFINLAALNKSASQIWIIG